MNRDSKGFTLIELVTVIAILGVLAAMTVPKFFSLQVKAKIQVEKQIIGTIRAGLETYAANEIVQNGTKTYPVSNTSTGTLLADVLNPIPAGWSYASTVATGGTITHARSDSNFIWTYVRGGTGDTYTIGARTVEP